MTLQMGKLSGYDDDVRDYAHIVFSMRDAETNFMIGVSKQSRNVYGTTVHYLQEVHRNENGPEGPF